MGTFRTKQFIILLLAAAQTILLQTATSTSIASSSQNSASVQYHTRSERSKSQKPVPASRERNYVKKLLSKLELEPTQQNIQRAKFAYEEEARKHTRELHTRRSSANPLYKGHVKSSRRSSKKCRIDCHLKRSTRNVRSLTYETLDVGHMRARTTSLVFDRKRLNLKSMKESFQRQTLIDNMLEKYNSDMRAKREVFNVDTRFDIQSNRQGKYPFSSVVRLSTGCSGIVVHPMHILTAAHCVHDGSTYVKGAKRLRVGRPRKARRGHGIKRTQDDNSRAFKWFKVKLVHFPKEWIKDTRKDNTIIEYDYALVVLRKPMAVFKGQTKDKTKRSVVMKIGVAPSAQNLRMNRLHFSNFDYTDALKMKYRFCPVVGESPDLYYNYCDSSRGSSGGGIYAKVPRISSTTDLKALQSIKRLPLERRVIATFSGHQYVQSQDGKREYNVGVKITPLKYTQICYWILKDEQHCKNAEDAIYA